MFARWREDEDSCSRTGDVDDEEGDVRTVEFQIIRRRW